MGDIGKLILSAAFVWVYPIAPILWAVLALVTLVSAMGRPLARSPRVVLRPSRTTRGLCAAAFWLALALLAYFFAFMSVASRLNGWWGEVLGTVLVLLAVALAFALAAALATVALRLVRTRGSREPVLGAEVFLAYLATVLGNAVPASLVIAISKLGGPGF